MNTKRPSPPSASLELEVLEAWNTMASRAGLPKCRGAGRVRKTIAARLRAGGWLNDFKAALPYVEGSAWCRGENERGWRADLEWLLRDGNAERYAGRAPEAGRSPGVVAPRRRKVVAVNGQGEPVFEEAE